MTDVITQELKRLKAYVAENELTLVDVAEKAELAYSTVREALQDGANPRVDTLKAIMAIVPRDFVPKHEAVQ